ncbi:MAG: tetratricopeptide repeat protein [Gemmatimonadetes bacterium]|nr:MAG: tetratricopeptide repeat protein [Gemmatimonadota bacterium]
MDGYTTREVADILGLSSARVRAFVRDDLLTPSRGHRNEYRFSFSDIVLLRTLRDLAASGVPPRRMRRALRSLRAQLPEGRPLSAVRVSSDGESVLVHDADTVWEPESGQLRIDFAVADLAQAAAPLALARSERHAAAASLDADAWFEMGADLEVVAPERAAMAYRQALALSPGHVHAHLNLGRLLHEDGALAEAESHYRQALAADPRSATAAFNLGVALEDQGRMDEAAQAYERALRNDPAFASAHFNLSRLYEAMGRSTDALRHLADYKRLKGSEA